ncbi:Predicted flavoprotein CzcO associated with the cation diffusion facilitator CzcD [Nonomuraea solani]|uniref:Predicted flavoprotein CzcO associated with the cation diffusion facilitator CzcD n=1 Tax=Nonomuraea solani TaxID=1144553 RepID=A0A1H6EJU5_9ACTN|nr:Predicted flavoprotein CzcO associated with the cation diffusion facilitator CzcD [Nonomuraea solani]
MVIGAGQAGLSSAYFLRRFGYEPLVLDAGEGAGGAWRHRSPSLTMDKVHGVFDLPGVHRPPGSDGDRPAAEVVPEYYEHYERSVGLDVLRPARVTAVRRGVDGRLVVESDAGEWSAGAVVNATGTWTRPHWPYYPGAADFTGRQLHYAGYRGPEEFAGRRVVVVGGGASAMHVLSELAGVAATTTWVTRRPPVFRPDDFGETARREAVALVEQRVRAGLPPQSVVSVTGLGYSLVVREALAKGALVRLPMFDRITENEVMWNENSGELDRGTRGGGAPDGNVSAGSGPAAGGSAGGRADGDVPGRGAWDGGRHLEVDTIIWATGFRSALDHLAPLRLREPGGGIRVDGTRVLKEPRLQLVGYGPSASTIGANRAGRTAAMNVRAHLTSASSRPAA